MKVTTALGDVHVLAASLHESTPATTVPGTDPWPTLMRGNTFYPYEYRDESKVGVADIAAASKVSVSVLTTILIHDIGKEVEAVLDLLPLLLTMRTRRIRVRRRLSGE